MKIGIIAEGWGDIAVIKSVLKGAMGVDGSDIKPLRPENDTDETDLHNGKMKPNEFSSWSLVKQDCLEKSKFEEHFKYVEEERLIVIHLDAAETQDYEVVKPAKQDLKKYSEETRNLIIAKIDDWLGGEYIEKIKYAIAVEETDAWLISIYSKKTYIDTCIEADPKKKLRKLLNDSIPEKKRTPLFQLDTFNFYTEVSRPLRKPKGLEKAKTQNHSLKLFCDSLIV